MKILVVTPYFYPHLGGSERYIESLYLAVMALDRSIQVDVLTYGFGRFLPVETYKGMKIYRVGGFELLKDQFAIPNYFQLIRLVKQLKVRHYDVINAHTRFFDSSWWAPIVSRYFRSKLVLTDHCAGHPQHTCALVKWIAKGIDHIIIPFLDKRYDGITVVSQATKLFLKNHGVKQAIIVIPNSIQAVKKITQKHKQAGIVSFVGRCIPAKGSDLFLGAADKLQKKYPHVTFQCLSGIDHESVMKQLAKTDVLVHPSRHHEGLPTVLLEAGLMKCAVAATSQGGTSEVIRDKKTGLIIQPTVESIVEALQKLFENSQFRLALGNQLHELVVQDFNWSHTSRTFLNWLNTLQ